MSASQFKKFDLSVSPEEDVAYLRLPTHPGRGEKGASARQIDLMSEFKLGKDVRLILDINHDNEIIGVEFILYK